MNSISISEQLKSIFPHLRLGCFSCEVSVQPSDQKIISLSEEIFEAVYSVLDIGLVSQKPTIKETKEAYRKLGKDPSRYRPSAEALTRRIVKGKDLFWINNIVDILNLISLESGFSIGGYDAQKIVGAVEFGIGKANDPYEAIGRGTFNIEDLPVFRDERGPFGSPTSDSMRTMVSMRSSKFLMIIIDFSSNPALQKALDRSIELYTKFAEVKSTEVKIITTM